MGSICVPSATTYPSEYIVSGYGKLSNSGSTTSSLQWVDQLYVPDSCCNARNGLAQARHVCAKSVTTSPLTDSCQGDSGGPLVINLNTAGDRETNPDWRLVGVVSSGTSNEAGNLCAAANNEYGIYESVISNRQWIDDAMLGSAQGGPITSGDSFDTGSGDLLFCFCKNQKIGSADADQLKPGDSLQLDGNQYTLLDIGHSSDVHVSGYKFGGVCLTRGHIVHDGKKSGPVEAFSRQRCECPGSYGFIFDKDIKVSHENKEGFITTSGKYHFTNRLVDACRFLGVCHWAKYVLWATDKLGI